MAEEYRKSLKQRLIDEDNFERLEMFDENVEESFLAGLKAGRPQWHDLRKDPNDLPKEDMYKAIIITLSGEPDIGIFRKVVGKCYWRIIGFNENMNVIAWKEIVLPKEIE